MENRIREYWDERAREQGRDHTATTNDVYLRELEIRTCVDALGRMGLHSGSRVLDVGCGDGYSTLAVAKAFPGVRFSGVDYAAGMIDLANAALANSGEVASTVQFLAGDVTALPVDLVRNEFDAVTSMRCLINLDSREQRAAAFSQIAKALKPNGALIASENFVEGQDELNRAREKMGLPAIPIRWHNRYFTEDDFRTLAGPYFESLAFADFAAGYYYATRVLYSAMCHETGEQPDYTHPIHRLAVRLPPTGRFSPVRLVTGIRRGAA